MGGHSCYEGGHRAHGGIPPVPPLGKTLKREYLAWTFLALLLRRITGIDMLNYNEQQVSFYYRKTDSTISTCETRMIVKQIFTNKTKFVVFSCMTLYNYSH